MQKWIEIVVLVIMHVFYCEVYHWNITYFNVEESETARQVMNSKMMVNYSQCIHSEKDLLVKYELNSQEADYTLHLNIVIFHTDKIRCNGHLLHSQDVDKSLSLILRLGFH